MKKIISAALSAVLLLGAMAFSATAIGTCHFYDDFSSGFSSKSWILRGGHEACAYIWDQSNRFLYGEDDAVALQTNFVDGGMIWKDCYYSLDLRIQKSGLNDSGSSNIILQFKDLFQSRIEDAPVYSYSIIPQTGEAFLVKEFGYTSAEGDGYSWVAMDKTLVPDYIQIDPNAAWFNIGMRVTEGRIECYFNGEKIMEAVHDPNDTVLGRYNQNTPDATVGTQKYPLVLLNIDNILNVDNVQVWTGDYDLTTTPGDVNGDGRVNLSDVSRLMQYTAKWNGITVDIHQRDLNGDGGVGLSDAARLMQYLAGWAVELG